MLVVGGWVGMGGWEGRGCGVVWSEWWWVGVGARAGVGGWLEDGCWWVLCA